MNYQYSTYFFAVLSIVLFGFLVVGSQSTTQEIAMSPTVMEEQDTVARDHSMHSMMMDMTGRMNGKTGDELDRIFLEDMIIHHQGALDMTELLLKETERPELQALGADIIAAQKSEISQMEAWLEEWFQ